MAERIICPVCGETNSADMEFCTNCQSRLHPLAGALHDESAPIQPGEFPTRKTTSELEPLLPQWLRDARQQARLGAAEDKLKAEQKPKEESAPPASDFLAGLASQRDDEDDDIPEWLANITGATSKKKKPAADDNQVKWVELGHEAHEPPIDQPSAFPAEAPASARPEKDDLSDWFKQAAASSETADFPVPPASESEQPFTSFEPQQPAPDAPPEDLSWLTRLGAAPVTPSNDQPGELPAVSADLPGWLKNLQSDAPAASPSEPTPAASTPAFSADVPDWLAQLGQETPAASEQQASAVPPSTGTPAVPDWLLDLRSSEPGAKEPEAQPSSEEPFIPTDLPDWMTSVGASHETPSVPSEPEPGPAPAQPPLSANLPDWVASLRNESDTALPPEEQPASEQPFLSTDLPDWMASLGTQPETLPIFEPAAQPDLPDWMASLGATTEQPTAAEPMPELEESAASPADLPDWVTALGGGQVPQPEELKASEPVVEAPAAKASPEELPSEGFTPEPLSGEDVDAVVASMKTPDWLSAVLPAAAPDENTPAAEPEEEIGPAQLPSWVQAMRPVESGAGAAGTTGEDAAPEKRGPLAGLHGVLPVVLGAADPSSKPKAHSIKLDATEQQLAHAALLEKIVAAETAPIPMKSSGVLRSQRAVRWIVSLVLLLAVAAFVFGGTQIFQLPSGVPNETIAAISAIEAIPADARVLVVFDYQPSTVGEMEAAGAPLLDHLMVLNHPRLVLLSTSPTGSALAERFMSSVLAGRGYVRGEQYVNLGYLPGGLAGVYNFAQSPSGAVPLDAQLKPAWQSSILLPIRSLSDFAAVIILTDAVESGQTWIEQTALTRGRSPMVIVASAQAGPMLLPYFDSGQVSGIVSGIYGAVGAEQRNAGSPGLVRRYWDAYSAGLYLAVTIIVLGALWNTWLGIRDRREQAVG